MRRKSFFYRIFLGNLFIVVLLIIAILFSSFHVIRSHYIKQLTANLTHIGKSLIPSVEPLLDKKKNVDSFVKKMGKQIKKRITVINRQGIVLGDSEVNPSIMENQKIRPEIQKAFQREIGVSLRYSRTIKKEMLYVAVPIYKNNTVKYVIRVSMFLTEIDQLLNALKYNILIIAIIIALILLVFSWFFSISLSSPIHKLVELTQSVARGDFKKRIYLNRNDEIKILGDNFNKMTEQLEGFVQTMRTEKIELQRIIFSLQEALVVIDKNDKIILMNRAFSKLVDSEKIENRYYWEIILNANFAKNIKKAKNQTSFFQFEIELKGKIYQCSISFIPQNQNTIAVFHDISEMKKLEQIKKDFVSNVSHELRTPLTVISGFLETLDEEETDSEKKRYLEIMHRSTHRLIHLVEDLLKLSELESRSFKLNLERVNLEDLLNNLLSAFIPKIKKKKLTLIKKIESVPPIKGDPFKLEQVFINLIDNAIKYTDAGSITINLKQEKEKIIFEIEDTGIGINEEEKERIFDRFYVVDKSRSKAMGGTGLGLSIVKHIVLLHNADLSVKSAEGKGTTFTIVF